MPSAPTNETQPHRVTNLEIPRDLAAEIANLAAEDMRLFKPEILVLVREAVEARKAARK